MQGHKWLPKSERARSNAAPSILPNSTPPAIDAPEMEHVLPIKAIIFKCILSNSQVDNCEKQIHDQSKKFAFKKAFVFVFFLLSSSWLLTSCLLRQGNRRKILTPQKLIFVGFVNLENFLKFPH